MTHASTADSPFATPGTLVRLSVGIESPTTSSPTSRRPSSAPARCAMTRHHRHCATSATSRAIAAYVVDTDEGPALFDCGPATDARPRSKEGLAAHGLAVGDLRNLLLSHIHLDHAGAAGHLVRANPALRVWVSEIGAPHLVDPSRLERSARRLYGEASTPSGASSRRSRRQNIRVVGERVLGLECFASPGHASHHVAYLDDAGTMYNGDVPGVRLSRAATCSPDAAARRRPRGVGPVDRRDRGAPAGADRTRALRRRRGHVTTTSSACASGCTLVERVGAGTDEDGFAREVEAEIARAEGEDAVAEYERAVTLRNCWHGLQRYWDKRREAAPAQW